MLRFKHTLSIVAMFTMGISALLAQPTLQNNVFPSIGQTISTASATDSNAVSEGAAGANQTWNFGGLQADITTATTINFQTPVGTPYEPSFPAANLCGVIFDSDNFYSYVQKSSTEIKSLGFATVGYSLVMANSQTILKVPLAYNASFDDTYWGTIDAGGFAITTYGETETKYDAYGTLILPLGTYTNAIRLKTVSTSIDTFDLGGGLLNITETLTTSYDWYKADLPLNLVNISYTEITSTSVIPGFPPQVETFPLSKSISFTSSFSSAVVDVPELEGISLNFRGANPVADVLALDVVTENAGENLQLQVYARNGQLLSGQIITTNGATLSIDVPVSNYAPGLYFVSITNGNGSISKGFVKM